jgi:putative FmdB family regulatory protein
MPIFEYRCRACGRDFEKLILSRNAPGAECPACASADVERLHSTFGVGASGAQTSRSAPVRLSGG